MKYTLEPHLQRYKLHKLWCSFDKMLHGHCWCSAQSSRPSRSRVILHFSVHFSARRLSCFWAKRKVILDDLLETVNAKRIISQFWESCLFLCGMFSLSSYLNDKARWVLPILFIDIKAQFCFSLQFQDTFEVNNHIIDFVIIRFSFTNYT